METTADSSKDEHADVCVICLCHISERATASCSHSAFDFLCLVSWLQERSTCPLCKAEVTAVTYQHRSPSDFKTYHVRPSHPPQPTSASPHTSQNLSAYPRYYSRPSRRPRTSRRPYSPPNPDLALLQRRYVYRNKLFSLHVGANRISQYQNFTPQMVANSSEIQSRARMWIRRELRVFSFLRTDPTDTPAQAATTSNNAEFLLMYIVSILKTVDIKASDGHAEDLLQEFLGRENARLFLHELNAWLRSPYTRLEDWDRHVQYREQLPVEFDVEGRAVPRGKNQRYSGRSRSPNPQRRRDWRGREASARYEPG